MDDQELILWLLISIFIGATGGFLNAIIFIVGGIDDKDFTPKLAFGWLIRDIFAGGGAGFGAWALNTAISNTPGLLFLIFIAGLAGTRALQGYLATQGYKNERDLLVQSTVNQNEYIEPLKNELVVAKQKLDETTIKLAEAHAKLTILAQDKANQDIRHSVERLEEQITVLRKRFVSVEDQKQSETNVDV